MAKGVIYYSHGETVLQNKGEATMYEIEVMFRDNGERFIGYGYNVKDMVRRYSKKFEGRTYDVLCVTYED